MDTSNSAKDLPIILLMQRHLKQLKTKYQRAVIFLYIEANMSYLTADRMAEAAKSVSSDIRIVCRDSKGLGRPGVVTGENEKRLYTDAISEALSSEALVYAKDFISDNTAQNQAKFEEQLQLFRRVVKVSTDDNAFAKAKVTWSGLGHDDTVMCVGIMLLFSRLTRQSPEYQKEAIEQRFDT